MKSYNAQVNENHKKQNINNKKNAQTNIKILQNLKLVFSFNSTVRVLAVRLKDKFELVNHASCKQRQLF